ncbi:thiamine pyrophosphate-binding protein [Rhodoplanes sp. TEM]|uniref:Thiamine pyrophosphate-binding protein n=1 Tax=Rhodoplanes tepidamans TaxID=200616 RepID=A0ABT5JEQ7_RHOTP|nr:MULTISPECIES: thiamine pyrophosphate-dependent enzyme [Rhodoplanes]MDC7787759.1 thiamine pyrophosphate-binding protein [Rhodoplanes tepidamans]MDC7982678.1 thiamine pyrophosphate-binding protein [Rhodoplanes sp. TEM]MDQ0357675.1 acetolactate synthase-1/2/3 large subunit [Rhodoplanes tepidamans]
MDLTTTADAAVAALLAHGIDTLYALPGVHNDPLFDSLWRNAERIRTLHARHEQGAAYMALGAALATGRPQAFAVVPGPGLLNASAAILTAYSMNAPVLGLVGQIPDAEIGLGRSHLHEIRDQAGIVARLVDFSARIRAPEQAAPLVAQAIRAMATGRPGPAILECGMDVWARAAALPAVAPPDPPPAPAFDEDALRAAAELLGAAKSPVIFVGGGAFDAADEIAALSAMLQAPVASGFRRGRGVLTSRDPLSVTHPLAHELWREADVVLAVGTRLFFQLRDWGVDDDLKVVHVNADPEEPTRHADPAVALVGDAAPILRRLIDLVPARNRARPSRRAEMEERQAKLRERLSVLQPQLAFLDAIRAALPDDGIFVDEVTQIGFAARLAMPVYAPRTFLSPGYQDNLGWGYATALGAADARRDVPVLSINGDGGFMYTANEIATAMRHRIPLVAVVFADGAFGNVRRIQEESYGNRLIACDLANPDFVKFAESFGASAERARTPAELNAALKRGFARRDVPTVIEVPVGPMPSPWPFIFLPKVRGL